MPSISTMKQLNAISGLIFGCFLILHLGNHFVLFVSFHMARDVQLKLRMIYQHPIIEFLMFVSLILHMYTNIMIYFHRQKLLESSKSKEEDGSQHKKKKPRLPPIDQAERTAHRYAGYILAIFVFAHAGATRLVPMILLKDSSIYDYTFITRVNRDLPLNSFAIYLLVLGWAGGWHMIYGTRSALATLSGSSILGKPFPISLKILAMLSHIGVLLSVLSVTGYFYGITFSESQKEWHKIMIDTMGI